MKGFSEKSCFWVATELLRRSFHAAWVVLLIMLGISFQSGTIICLYGPDRPIFLPFLCLWPCFSSIRTVLVMFWTLCHASVYIQTRVGWPCNEKIHNCFQKNFQSNPKALTGALKCVVVGKKNRAIISKFVWEILKVASLGITSRLLAHSGALEVPRSHLVPPKC